MLALLDRRLKGWHVALVTALALAWWLGMYIATTGALRVALLRCPLGFCVTGYSANSVTLMLRLLGDEGRDFLRDTLMPLDRPLPALVMATCLLNYVWWTRPGDRYSASLDKRHRYMLMGVPVAYCVADYIENWAFTAILASYPQISYRAVLLASSFTALKSQLIAASLGILAALIVTAIVIGRRGPPTPRAD